MKALSAHEILFLHAQLATRLGLPRGVADAGALAATLREVADATLGLGLFELAATLATAFARHRLFDAGNLALAAAAAGLLLRRYDLDLQLDPAEMPVLRALLLAGDPAHLADWLRAHTLPLP